MDMSGFNFNFIGKLNRDLVCKAARNLKRIIAVLRTEECMAESEPETKTDTDADADAMFQ